MRILPQVDAKNIIKSIKETGGASYAIGRGAVSGPGFAVSLESHERVFHGIPSEKDVENYIRDNVVALTKPNAFVGAWVDGHKTYLDVSIKVETLELAKVYGKAFNQKAIFDLDKGEVINL